jgi:hypothetical protein
LAYWVFGFGVADTVATANTMDINLIVILAGVILAFGIYLHGGKEFLQVLLLIH